uniref:Trafficking protein particle complex subunit n=1 Tax=Ailuropoda melanoleuca TaxID=9646 RepID=A0A7N5JI92_AILME
MTVHNLYLFDRNGVCLHYSEWHRKKQAGIPKEEEYKLMYGMLFSIRSFVSKMSPLDMKDGFLAFQTSRYKLHYYETPTGIKVVMNTDLGVGPIRDVLHHIYSAEEGRPAAGPRRCDNHPPRFCAPGLFKHTDYSSCGNLEGGAYADERRVWLGGGRFYAD